MSNIKIKKDQKIEKLLRNDFDAFTELFFDNLPKDIDPEEITIKEAKVDLFINSLMEYFCEEMDYDFNHEDYDESVPEDRKKLRSIKLSRDIIVLELGNFLHELIINKSFYKIGSEIYDLFLGFDDQLIQEVDQYKNVCRIYSILGYAFYFLDDTRAIKFLKKSNLAFDEVENIAPFFYLISQCYMNGIGVIENYKKCYSYLLITNSYKSHEYYKDKTHEVKRHLTKKDIILCQENAEELLANYKKEKREMKFIFL